MKLRERVFTGRLSGFQKPKVSSKLQEPIRIRSICTCNRHQGRENPGESVTICFGFCFPLVEKVARVAPTNQSESEVMQEQSECELLSTLK